MNLNTNKMRKQTLKYVLLMALLTTFSGCAVVEGIFKMGMGVGIFLVVLVIALIIYVISRIFKSRK